MEPRYRGGVELCQQGCPDLLHLFTESVAQSRIVRVIAHLAIQVVRALEIADAQVTLEILAGHLTEMDARLVIEARVRQLVSQLEGGGCLQVAASHCLGQIDTTVLVGNGRIVLEGDIFGVDLLCGMVSVYSCLGHGILLFERFQALRFLLQIDIGGVDGGIQHTIE